MADDIVNRLRDAADAEAAQCDASPCDCQCQNLIDAADEIERLHAALALAVGELSTHAKYTTWSPDRLMNRFIVEARGG